MAEGLTCKILPGCEGSAVVHGALQHPEVRARRVGKLDEDVRHVEELERKEPCQCVEYHVVSCVQSALLASSSDNTLISSPVVAHISSTVLIVSALSVGLTDACLFL